MHNTASVFPENVDSRAFFSDVQLKHAIIHNGYNDLIQSADYQGASRYLYQNVELANVNMDYNGAYLWNRFDNILKAVEDYAVAMDSTGVRPVYDSVEPTETWENQVWIA